MVGAKSPEDAFRVLTELQYARDFDEATQPRDFFKIIKKGLLETKKLIMDGTDENLAFEFIWKEYDLSNIKRALKLKFLDGATELGKFTESDGFAFLGSLSAAEIDAAVFHGEVKPLPREYREALIRAEEIFHATKSFRSIEFVFDRAHFEFLNRVAESHSIPVLRELLELRVDGTNLRSAARAILAWDETLTKEAILPYGTLSEKDLLEANSVASLKKVFKQHPFFERFEKTLEEGLASEDILIRLERQMHNALIEWLSELEAGDIGTFIVPMAYLQKRIRNASRIRFIMAAKFYGIAPEKIYETLKHF